MPKSEFIFLVYPHFSTLLRSALYRLYIFIFVFCLQSEFCFSLEKRSITLWNLNGRLATTLTAAFSLRLDIVLLPLLLCTWLQTWAVRGARRGVRSHCQLSFCKSSLCLRPPLCRWLLAPCQLPEESKKNPEKNNTKTAAAALWATACAIENVALIAQVWSPGKTRAPHSVFYICAYSWGHKNSNNNSFRLIKYCESPRKLET